MDKNSKTITAREWVEQLLVSIAPGDPLPSLRTMMEESGLTRTFLMQVLRGYEEVGAIRIVPRSGIYRLRDNVVKPCSIVDIIACGDRNYTAGRKGDFFPELIELLVSRAFKYNCAVRLHSIKPTEDLECYRELAALEDNRGFVLIHTGSQELVDIFSATGRPVVHLMPDARFSNCVQIVDNDDIIPRIVKSAVAAGHKRIAYMHEQDERYSTSCFLLERLEDFCRIITENDLELKPEWQIFGRCNSVGMREAVKRMFASKPYPEVLIANDRYMSVIYEHISQTGLRVGEDIALIGHDGLRYGTELIPLLTTLAVDREAVVEKVWNLVAFGKSGDVLSWQMPVQWRAGESFCGELL